MIIEIIKVVLLMLIIILEFIILIKLKYYIRKREEAKDISKRNRVHSKISNSSYDTSYTKRGYDTYKNKIGLYEPQIPSRGIEIKKGEE